MGTYSLIPLRTHVITQGENLVEIVRQYTEPVGRPGDVLAIAESVAAIAQGRIILPEDIRPGVLANLLCRFPGKEGSLTSPHTVELVVREAGACRVALGAVLACLGWAFHIRGVFYRIAGPTVKLIDDVSGTMPPFERYIVLGPADPDRLAQTIEERIGLPVLIVDANDLGRVDLVGTSHGLSPAARRACLEALAGNPFGNADQQTPIVLLRPGTTPSG